MNIMYLEKTLFHSKIMIIMERRKLVKRKNGASKGNA